MGERNSYRRICVQILLFAKNILVTKRGQSRYEEFSLEALAVFQVRRLKQGTVVKGELEVSGS